jgi:hypothetical protein
MRWKPSGGTWIRIPVAAPDVRTKPRRHALSGAICAIFMFLDALRRTLSRARRARSREHTQPPRPGRIASPSGRGAGYAEITRLRSLPFSQVRSHPFQGACASHYRTAGMNVARDGGAIRQAPRHGRGPSAVASGILGLFFPVSLFDLEARFFAPTHTRRTPARTGAVKAGRRSARATRSHRFQAVP